MNDILVLLQWYSVLLVAGVLFFPITAQIFSSFPDRGYIFSKIISITITAYLVFLFGTLKLLPFTEPVTYGIFLSLGVLNLLFFKWKKPFQVSKPLVLLVLIEELLFFVALAIWTYIRAHEPSINGLEKFMDFGFINSIMRSEYFPPTDMWFPPLPINYYYFGHLLTAVLTKLSYLPTNFTYNLMVSTLFAFCISGSFSIGFAAAKLFNLSSLRSGVAGIISGLLVAVGGNTHTIYSLFTAYQPAENPVPFWQLAFRPLEIFSNNGYWYPNATRYIPNTIHEFPLYSFVVSDLHGHVLDIPIVITCVALLLQLFVSKKYSVFYGVFLGFLLSVMYMTNVLDFGIYTVLSCTVIAFLLYQKSKRDSKKKNSDKKSHESAYNYFFSFLKIIGTILISAFVFALPFSIHFKPFASGVGVLCAPKILTNIGSIGPLLFEADHCQRSEWWMLLTLYAFFYFFVFVLIFNFWRDKKSRLKQSYVFMIILSFVATLFIIIPEFAYIKDIYPDHYRANTMFKLTYQSFIMLSLVSGFVISAVVIKKKNIILSLITILLLSIVLMYPRFAVYSYYNSLLEYSGIDGTAYLKNRYPDDYKAINWINSNISGQPVILESQGDSYTDHARISSNTGLPTVLGWTVHEWLWRGSYDVPAPRITDIQTLYETTDLTVSKNLINKHKIEYIYVGNLEREKYANISEIKFFSLGNIIFQNDTVRIYQIKTN
jgi:uncharacterized membrane protein